MRDIIPKINSIHFGGKWIGIAMFTGLILPFVLWLLTGHFYLWLTLLGGIFFILFLFVFAIEMWQDHGKVSYYERHMRESLPFDPNKQYAIIRASICTGEKVAGFKNKDDGHFTEVMIIRNLDDKKRFMNIYGLETVKTEY